MHNVCFVIPCYNEERRLDVPAFERFMLAAPEDGPAVAAIEKLIGKPIPRVEVDGMESLELDMSGRRRRRGRAKPREDERKSRGADRKPAEKRRRREPKVEEPVDAPQYNLDGYVFNGEVHAIGVCDAVMYPGTGAFQRFERPSRLGLGVQQRALDVATRFLKAVGFTHGFFNMEFFYDASTDALKVIEFNPRLASQLADAFAFGFGDRWN